MKFAVRQTVAGLRADDSAVPSPRTRRRGRLSTAAVGAVAAGLAVTGCAAAASAAPASAPAGQPSFGATAGAAVQQAAAILSPGQAGAASASGIPWSQVGSGWALAEYTKGSYKRAAGVSLYLVS